MTIPTVKWRIEDRGTRNDPRFYVIRETRGSQRVARFGPHRTRADAAAARDTLKRDYRP